MFSLKYGAKIDTIDGESLLNPFQYDSNLKCFQSGLFNWLTDNDHKNMKTDDVLSKIW